jgi:hypothetical protein
MISYRNTISSDNLLSVQEKENLLNMTILSVDLFDEIKSIASEQNYQWYTGPLSFSTEKKGCSASVRNVLAGGVIGLAGGAIKGAISGGVHGAVFGGA